MFSRVIAAMKSARARAEAGIVYQKLITDARLLRDVGVNQNDVRHALLMR